MSDNNVQSWVSAIDTVFKTLKAGLEHGGLNKMQSVLGIWQDNVRINQSSYFVLPECGIFLVNFNVTNASGAQSESIKLSISMAYGKLKIGFQFVNAGDLMHMAGNAFDNVVPSKKPAQKSNSTGFMVDWEYADEWLAKIDTCKDMMKEPCINDAVSISLLKEVENLLFSIGHIWSNLNVKAS